MKGNSAQMIAVNVDYLASIEGCGVASHIENNGQLLNNEEGTEKKLQQLFTNLMILKKLRCCVDRRVKHENWIL